MSTITIPKTKYEILEKKATLYERFFKKSPEAVFDVEEYSPKRIKEFLKEDKISKESRKKVERILKSL